MPASEKASSIAAATPSLPVAADGENRGTGAADGDPGCTGVEGGGAHLVVPP